MIATDEFKSVRCIFCSEYIVNGTKGWRRPLNVPLDIKTLRQCEKSSSKKHAPLLTGNEDAPLLGNNDIGRIYPSNGEILHLKRSTEIPQRRTRTRRTASVTL